MLFIYLTEMEGLMISLWDLMILKVKETHVNLFIYSSMNMIALFVSPSTQCNNGKIIHFPVLSEETRRHPITITYSNVTLNFSQIGHPCPYQLGSCDINTISVCLALVRVK